MLKEKLREARKSARLTQRQVDDAIEAKRADPLEEVSYMTRGGFIVVDFE